MLVFNKILASHLKTDRLVLAVEDVIKGKLEEI